MRARSVWFHRCARSTETLLRSRFTWSPSMAHVHAESRAGASLATRALSTSAKSIARTIVASMDDLEARASPFASQASLADERAAKRAPTEGIEPGSMSLGARARASIEEGLGAREVREGGSDRPTGIRRRARDVPTPATSRDAALPHRRAHARTRRRAQRERDRVSADHRWRRRPEAAIDQRRRSRAVGLCSSKRGAARTANALLDRRGVDLRRSVSAEGSKEGHAASARNSERCRTERRRRSRCRVLRQRPTHLHAPLARRAAGLGACSRR